MGITTVPIPARGSTPLPTDDVNAAAAHVKSANGVKTAASFTIALPGGDSDTGGRSRGIANRVRAAVAKTSGVDVKNVGASVKVDGETLTVAVWRKS